MNFNRNERILRSQKFVINLEPQVCRMRFLFMVEKGPETEGTVLRNSRMSVSPSHVNPLTNFGENYSRVTFRSCFTTTYLRVRREKGATLEFSTWVIISDLFSFPSDSQTLSLQVIYPRTLRRIQEVT